MVAVNLDISVIVPAYLAADTIGRALSSIAAQTSKPKEIIVVDDGSDDATAEIAEGFRSQFENCRFLVLSQFHQGPGAARNAGLREASCELVAFLDADDEWFASHLASTVSRVISDGLTLAAHNEILVIDDEEYLNDSLSRFRECTDPYVALYRKGCVSTSTVVARRDAVIQVGGFDPKLSNGQDVDLWLAILCEPGAKFDVFEEPLSRYFIRPGSVNSNITKRHFFFMKIARRWAGEIINREDGAVSDLWFRISAIHYESFKDHWKNSGFLAAFFVCLKYPFNMVEISARGLLKTTPNRRLPPIQSIRNSKATTMVNPFINTSKAAQTATTNQQHRNRDWWQAKPMTYADWAADDREPCTANDFLEMENYVLRTGPWLKTWFESNDFTGLQCLDLGSGSGIFSSMLSRRDAHVTAMDLTDAAVNLTRKTASFFGCAVSSVRCDAECSPFEGAAFDFVFSWGVLHHTHDMDAALKEVGRILKPGGRGMIMVYNRRSVVYYIHGLYWLLVKGKVFRGHSLRSVQDFYTDGYYHRYMTAAELRSMLKKSGLHVRRFSVTQYEKKILPFTPSRLDEWLKARFGMCLIAEFEKSTV